jgi:transcriptional regulator with XRE-family HTH domain
MDDQPDPIDLHVGEALRVRRKQMNLSQSALGEALDVTFQQVQKYERGNNRLSASALYKAAKALQVPVEYFFVGYEPAVDLSDSAKAAIAARDSMREMINMPGGMDVIKAFTGSARARHPLASVARLALKGA